MTVQILDTIQLSRYLVEKKGSRITLYCVFHLSPPLLGPHLTALQVLITLNVSTIFIFVVEFHRLKRWLVGLQ